MRCQEEKLQKRSEMHPRSEIVRNVNRQCSNSPHFRGLVAISQHVCVSTVDVRSDLSNRQLASGSVTTENVNIVADEADGAGSGAIAVSAFALEFGAN